MTAERVSLAPQPNKGVTMPRKKKEETIDDIIDRIESDLETIRDKAVEDQDWEDDIDEDEEEDKTTTTTTKTIAIKTKPSKF
jgi:hypothetical protein